ncbi:MAG: nitronate monooxygenase [Gammaproteobacteria bacterium]|nr:nitronate monooxygenase [Gammaproteobacteria bacterium]
MGGDHRRTIRTRFTERYGLVHPIAAAGMAFVTMSPALAVAVAEAGAMGAFAAGILPPDLVRENLRAIRARTDSPLHLNLITPFATEKHIDLCIDERPEVVSFHWQHPPLTWLSRLHAAGIEVWEQVGSPGAARQALDDGIDLIIAQGSEAGGHCRGELPTFVATPAIIDAAEGALVLAAGGIVDGRGLAAALALGADGAWVGTRLVATIEADVAPEYKRRIVDAAAGDTVLTSMFGEDRPDFNPMRVLRNGLVREFETAGAAGGAGEKPVVGHTTIAGQSLPIRRFSSLIPVRDATGDFEQMALPAGEGVGGVREILAARQVIEEMIDEALGVIDALHRAAAFA